MSPRQPGVPYLNPPGITTLRLGTSDNVSGRANVAGLIEYDSEPSYMGSGAYYDHL